MSRFWKKNLLRCNHFFRKPRLPNTKTLPFPKSGVKSVTFSSLISPITDEWWRTIQRFEGSRSHRSILCYHGGWETPNKQKEHPFRISGSGDFSCLYVQRHCLPVCFLEELCWFPLQNAWRCTIGLRLQIRFSDSLQNKPCCVHSHIMHIYLNSSNSRVCQHGKWIVVKG